MPASESLLFWRQETSRGAGADLDTAIDLLNGTRTGHTQPMIRIYQPRPTVAFGQRDRRMPGFEQAAIAVERLGFTPLIRRAGGRAAAYHPGALVVDHIEPDADAIRGSQWRFESFAQLFAEALDLLDIGGVIGPIPGEYCYGDYSVHGVAPAEPDRRIKLVGTAQRQVGTGWLFSTVILAEQGELTRRVLHAAYAGLGLEWDPLTAGAASDLKPGVTVPDVEAAILEVYRRRWTLHNWHPEHSTELA